MDGWMGNEKQQDFGLIVLLMRGELFDWKCVSYRQRVNG
jgi:hypothetical protein